MKLKFENQQFQNNAVDSVCDLFRGQEKMTSTFSLSQLDQQTMYENGLGVGNAMIIDSSRLADNMHEIQKNNILPLSELDDGVVEKENGETAPQFCVEMETGTGKTYVYIKTILELNKRYGFTKFIIVVPSVAIREGVYKSFEVTHEHFANLYDNVPYSYFIYNSAKLSDVRQFAVSSDIEIMIINIDAFKKSENVINQPQDRMNGETAISYIKTTNPIVIIDEPQSVDNTPKSKEAIAELNPLCVLRYSATHKEKINTVYRLTPVDAYQMGLVKQICVASVSVESDFNKPYVRLVSVSNDNGFKAKIEIDVKGTDRTVTRKTVTAKQGADLYQLSGERELYDGYQINGIDCTPNSECIEFTNGDILKLGHSMGGIDENIIKKEQIKRTLETHFDKELMLNGKGIKVLSLFFIDKVEKYRTETGEKGIYAKMFKECYNELINKPKYAEIKERYSNVSAAHNGYFSQDKRGKFKDTKGNTNDDFDTYNTIMKDKEWLLSFDCPLRFIWSHSALREGWDNPNVFQVCTLIDQKSIFTCRQKIGRGLRLCVNQKGERIEDKNINVLHVIANESFADFADSLQHEIETETGIKFGVLQLSMFSGMTYTETKVVEKKVTEQQAEQVVEVLKDIGIVADDGKIDAQAAKAVEIVLPQELEEVKEVVQDIVQKAEIVDVKQIAGTEYTEIKKEEKTITYNDAVEIMEHFEKKDYITKAGKIKDTMKNALKNGTLDLPKKYEAAKERFESIIRRSDKNLPIRNANREVVVKLNKQALISPEFQELWDKIKYKTTYRIKFDTQKLIEKSIQELQAMPPVPNVRLVSKTADIDIRNEGILHTERQTRLTDLNNDDFELPDVLSIVSEQATVKRSTVCEIIKRCGRENDFLKNPQMFIEQLIHAIRTSCCSLDINGISYKKIDGSEYYLQEIFDSKELIANLDRNAVKVDHSVYDYVVYDSSTVERPFAVALDNDPDVKMFFKIPKSFKIDTPIGTYNPDWAVSFNKNGEQKLYFVIETKGTTELSGLRDSERDKIKCGKEHFKAINENIKLDVATEWSEFKKNI